MDHYQKYLNKALRFLSYRSRSEKEVLDYLRKKQAPEEIKEQILTFLRERRFVNDEEFARGWIDQRMRVNAKALRVIEMELKQKGVAQEVIAQAISNVKFPPLSSRLPPSSGLISSIQESEGVSDLGTAKVLVSKKIEKYKHLPKQELYQKLGGFLGRKGFDWETIKKAIELELKSDR
jgi:regulatory protein